MKKILVYLITLTLVFSSSAVVFAAENTADADNDNVSCATANLGVEDDDYESDMGNTAHRSSASFKDVDESDWFYEAVCWAVENGVFEGYSVNRFGPNDTCTRAQAATLLYRAAGEPALLDMTAEGSYNELNSFKDISKDSYYYRAVLWANAVGIVKGTGNDKFKPDEKVTREQLAAMIYRYAEYKGFDMTLGDDTNILDYDDIFDTAEYAMPAFQWCCGSGVIEGMGKILGSKKNATRAQVAAILNRLLTKDLMPLQVEIDDLAGNYVDKYTNKAIMKISKPDEQGRVNITVSQTNSTFETLVFKMTAELYRDVLSYSDCDTYEYLFDSEIEEDKVLYYILPIENDLTGYFVVKKDRTIAWEGANDKEHENSVFVKVK